MSFEDTVRDELDELLDIHERFDADDITIESFIKPVASENNDREEPIEIVRVYIYTDENKYGFELLERPDSEKELYRLRIKRCLDDMVQAIWETEIKPTLGPTLE